MPVPTHGVVALPHTGRVLACVRAFMRAFGVRVQVARAGSTHRDTDTVTVTDTDTDRETSADAHARG